MNAACESDLHLLVPGVPRMFATLEERFLAGPRDWTNVGDHADRVDPERSDVSEGKEAKRVTAFKEAVDERARG